MTSLLKKGNFWTIVFGIVGLLAGLLFYLASLENKEPVYFISERPMLIYNVENPSKKLTVLLEDSLKVNKNIFAKTIYLWNNGNSSIDSIDIRSPLQIYGIEGAKIIDYNIVRENHPGISNFHILSQDSVGLVNWDFFDPGFLVEIQVVYSGYWRSKIEMSGYVLGHRVKKVSRRVNRSKGGKAFGIILIVLAFLAIISMTDFILKEWSKGFSELSGVAVGILLALFAVYYLICEFFVWGYEMPKF